MNSSLFDSSFLTILLPHLGTWALRAFPVIFTIIAEILWIVRSKSKIPLFMIFFSIMGLIWGLISTCTFAFMITGDITSLSFKNIQFAYTALQLINGTLWGLSFIAAVFVTTAKKEKVN